MRSDSTRSARAFTVPEIVVTAAILLLMILAILPAFRSGQGEEHFSLQPRSTPIATPQPDPASTFASAPPTPAPVRPRTSIR